MLLNIYTIVRLLVDKDYLGKLARGIGERPGDEEDVEMEVAETAHEALEFLKSREKFWNQIKLGESGAKLAKNKKGKPR